MRALRSGEYVSGQRLSEELGVSRMAVSKAVAALREAGYTIEAAPRRGYRLTGAADILSAAEIRAALGDHPWADRITVLPEVDSTNNYAKKLAQSGAPDGSVVVAEQQTGGRGRMGRSFSSPPGLGVYLTVLLRPGVRADALGDLTVRVAAAMCDAVERAAGVRPGIKWTNDLILGGKKLCGILTELSVEAESGMAEFVVAGIGVNVGQTPDDFPPEVRPVATSLREQTGKTIPRARLAAEMIRALSRVAERADEDWLEKYRADCVTIGRQVRVIRAGAERTARADGVDETGALLVTWDDDGSHERIFSGEVSVRGLLGYV